jgi:hypothetical protein
MGAGRVVQSDLFTFIGVQVGSGGIEKANIDARAIVTIPSSIV